MVKNVRRMDSNRWATVGLLEITNPHKYWAFWVSYATSPTKNKQVTQLAYFLSIAKAMVYHQCALHIVSHQPVRAAYHHEFAVYQNAFALMICNSLRN